MQTRLAIPLIFSLGFSNVSFASEDVLIYSEDEVLALGNELGAIINKVTIMEKHEYVTIGSIPLLGGMLRQLGIKKGDVIKSVNGHRTRSEADLSTTLTSAKAKKFAEITFRGPFEEKWKTIKKTF